MASHRAISLQIIQKHSGRIREEAGPYLTGYRPADGENPVISRDPLFFYVQRQPTMCMVPSSPWMVDGWADNGVRTSDQITYKIFSLEEIQERYACNPAATRSMTTAQLREQFLLQELMKEGTLQLVYSHFDR